MLEKLIAWAFVFAIEGLIYYYLIDFEKRTHKFSDCKQGLNRTDSKNCEGAIKWATIVSYLYVAAVMIYFLSTKDKFLDWFINSFTFVTTAIFPILMCKNFFVYLLFYKLRKESDYFYSIDLLYGFSKDRGILFLARKRLWEEGLTVEQIYYKHFLTDEGKYVTALVGNEVELIEALGVEYYDPDEDSGIMTVNVNFKTKPFITKHLNLN
jgi:hypothetical protein